MFLIIISSIVRIFTLIPFKTTRYFNFTLVKHNITMNHDPVWEQLDLMGDILLWGDDNY